MTTPEKLKARQLQIIADEARNRRWLRWEGLILGLLLIVIAVSSILDEREQERQTRVDTRQEQCLAKAFGDLSNVLEKRGDLATRERDAIGDVLVAADKDRTPGSATLEAALEDYVATRRMVKAELKKSEIPPFPTGKCDENRDAH